MSAATLPAQATLTPTGEAFQAPPPRKFSQRVHEYGPTRTIVAVIPDRAIIRKWWPRHVIRRTLLGVVRDPRLRVKRGIPVRIERKGKNVTAYCPDLEEFGSGPNLSASLEDLAGTLSELYLSLEEQHDNLGPHMALIQQRLAEYIERR